MTPFKQMNGNFYRAYSFVTFKFISALILPFSRPLRQYKNLPAQILQLHTTEMRCYRKPTAIFCIILNTKKIKGKSAPKSNIFKIVSLIFPKL